MKSTKPSNKEMFLLYQQQKQEREDRREDRREDKAYKERLMWRQSRRIPKSAIFKDPLKGLSLDRIWDPKTKSTFD